MFNFIGQEIEVGKKYVYLKNERTGSSTTRKLKMIGECVESGKRLKFERLFSECGSYLDKYSDCSDGEKVIDTLNSSDDVICEYTGDIS